MSVPQHCGGYCDLFPNVLDRMSSLKLHVEVHDHAEQDYGDDDRAADRIVQHDRDGAGSQKNENERIGKKAEETHQSGEARLPHQAVWAMDTQPLFRFGGCQAGWSCFEQCQQVLQRYVPKSVQRFVRFPHT